MSRIRARANEDRLAIRPDADSRTHRSDAGYFGSPAHFATFVREADRQRGSGVIVPDGVTIRGFIVPPDGIWIINGKWVPAGEELSLAAGTRIKYHEAGVDVSLQGDDPRFQRQARRGRTADPRQVASSRIFDRADGALLRTKAGEIDGIAARAGARQAARRAGKLPGFARGGRRTPAGLIVPD